MLLQNLRQTRAGSPSQQVLKLQLSGFMFLQYFVWGSWYVSMGTYLANRLKFRGEEIGAAYGAFAIGAMVSPFFVGLIADRFFASEKLLAALGILGGAVLCELAQLRHFWGFYLTLILYCSLFTPTLALGNSLAMHHLRDAKKDFPRVKVLSAVGWIGGGVTLSFLHGEESNLQFYLAGVVSAACGLFALLLPSTPPKKVGANVSWGEVLGLDALALMKIPSFAIFIACMFLICIPLCFYFVMMSIYLTELGWSHLAGKMTLAQVSDVIFLFLLPLILKPLGYKITVAIGILAWMTRYFLLAGSVTMGDWRTEFIFAAIILHGMCYDFLFIVGQLYVDEQANERNRGAAQGFIAFILWGLGAFVGTMLAGKALASHQLVSSRGPLAHAWRDIWSIPAFGATAILVIFLLSFAEPKRGARLAER